MNPDRIYFSGDYPNWDLALLDCEVHPTEPVRERVLAATLKIRDNQAVEQGVFSGRSPANFPLLTALLSATLKSEEYLKVLDFGGSLGISYFHSRRFLGPVRWSVVELPELVALGSRHFASNELSFYDSIENCLWVDHVPKIVLLSGVLQCLPEPWETLRRLLEIRAPFVFLDRTALIDSGTDRLTVQHVPASIYRIDHPAWFLNEGTLTSVLADAGYECLCDFPAIDRYTIPGASISFKGFFFRLLPS